MDAVATRPSKNTLNVVFPGSWPHSLFLCCIPSPNLIHSDVLAIFNVSTYIQTSGLHSRAYISKWLLDILAGWTIASFKLCKYKDELIIFPPKLKASPRLGNDTIGHSFPDGSVVKTLPANAGDISWTRKIPWRRKWQPTLFLPGKSHRQRSLAGYSPCSHKELNVT